MGCLLARASLVGDRLEARASLVGDRLEARASLVCDTGNVSELTVTPQYIWLTPSNNYTEDVYVITTTDWVAE